MSIIFQTIAAVAAVVFAFAMLVKVGVPMFIAAIVALIAGFFIWRWEAAESEKDEPAWMTWIGSLKDLKDISKYLQQIF